MAGRWPITTGLTVSDNAARRARAIDKTHPVKRDHPAKRVEELQRRVRGLPALLSKGEAYHVELDAIASALGVLSMDLESYDPSCHAFRSPRTSAPAAPGRSVHTAGQPTAASVFRGFK